MLSRVLRAKLHRVTVTQADLNYRGSVTIDQELLRKVGLMPLEEVDIWDITNGSRLRTYVIPGPPGSRVVCINGAAAHLIKPKDLVIIAAYSYVDHAALKNFTSKVIMGTEHGSVENPAGSHPNDIGSYNEMTLKVNDPSNWEFDFGDVNGGF